MSSLAFTIRRVPFRGCDPLLRGHQHAKTRRRQVLQVGEVEHHLARALEHRLKSLLQIGSRIGVQMPSQLENRLVSEIVYCDVHIHGHPRFPAADAAGPFSCPS